ncbi:MAG: M48 family metalloprotease [Saprospiraceae bacterium]|nr:M48 family metalloprotease [Saprospiraceae bacterium]MCF8251869.1 M48 family metalloprotease [Saprospiraceae bacterium]MCF8283074.1 M48 family metalloprotease [Bacteroidales bacterium]MCF8313546.1 M48 family metalloprotease [Saprospiraceae bacterium]MCF8442617.1 M48 family metalloprotease [Saprospiraceae bacterium]
MELINQILPTETLHALGWTVLHSLWQAFAVALLLAAYLLAWQKTDARKRYIAGNLAMAVTLLLAVGTFIFYLNRKSPQPELASAIYRENGTLLGQYSIEGNQSFFYEYFSQNMPLIVAVWLVGMVFFVLKMLGGLLYIQRLKTRMTAQLPHQWQERLVQLSAELDIRRPVQLLESALAHTPMVIGWLKPIVLLPIGAVNYLTPAQVEAILAHELAHIARHDYLLNLLQSFVEILFYFNPAVWWMSAHVRTERENCCDDIAVRLCGNSLAYAKALVSLQEMQLASPALAMTFSKNKNQLLLRIQRILQPSQNKSNVMEKLSATLLLTVAVVLLSVQANTPFGNLISRVASKALPLNEVMANTYLTKGDTIPNGTQDAHIHFNNDDEDIEFKMKDDKIVMLKVGGKEIPASQYGDYEDRIQELLANLPEPPASPEAPEMPEFPEMPAPPAPPSFHEFPVALAPPAPPRTRTITTQKDRNGTTFIIESQDGSDPVEIKVKDGKKGTIIVNGQEITGLKKGDKTIIMQDVPGSYNFWNGDFPPNGFQFNFESPELAEAFHFDPAQFDFERNFEMNPEAMEEFHRAFSADKLRMMADVERVQAHSNEWQELMEHQRAIMEEQMVPLQEELNRVMERNREVMERAMEKASDSQREAMELELNRSMQDARQSHERLQQQLEKELQKKQKEKNKTKKKGAM